MIKSKNKNEWFLIDAKEQVLGRLASQVAMILMGKHRVDYAANRVFPDQVVIVNAALVRATGRKEKQKKYYRHTGYPGGLKIETLGKLRADHPERIIKAAVSGMLPKNKLHDLMLLKLHLFPSDQHPFTDKFQE